MFHKRTGQIAAILMLFSVSAQPIIAHASEPPAPAIQSEPSPALVDKAIQHVQDFSFD